MKKTMFALFATLGLAGCQMMNDNPTSPDQMQAIRKKEAESRQNFHPGGGPPTGAPASGAGK